MTDGPLDAALPHAAPQPVSARAWLSQNGPWLIFFALGIGFVYTRYGADVLLSIVVALIGLGFVIFIHELGHFLAAKWCDVHVLTFSIGFGPAVPGCSFTRGETMYKLALLPLGGYVNMVGEGPEADEEEDYPRSFKNKTVGQRMLIISAGVIMNVLFGALCFVLVYLYLGVERPPAIVWRTESGSRAWEAGVKPGWRLARIEDKKDPGFDDMRVAVALSPAGKPLEFVFEDRDGKTHRREIEPLRDANNNHPVIGVSPSSVARLLPEKYGPQVGGAATRAGSAAAGARVVSLQDGETPVRATDPAKGGDVTPLPPGEAGWLELCRRMRAASDEAITLEVASGGKTRTMQVPTGGFRFGDSILGTTDPATPDRPFNVSPLPTDPHGPPKKQDPDPFVLRARMASLAGKAMVLQVRREANDEVVNVLVPPAFHVSLGLRMNMGKVAAIRQGSPAEEAELKAGPDGDEIIGATLQADGKPPIVLDEKAMDPVRLPFELERRMAELGPEAAKYRVVLKVRGPVNHNARKERTLPPMKWDAGWSSADEAPINPSAPTSIPQLGLAYWIESTVVKVEPDGPAQRAGILPGDVVQEISFRERGSKGDMGWSRWYEMASRRAGDKVVYDQWAHYFWYLQRADAPVVRVKLKRVADSETTELELPPREQSEDAGWWTATLRGAGLRKSPPPDKADQKGIDAVTDPTWPMSERGLIFDVDKRRHKAKTFVEALGYGMEKTSSFIQQIYRNLQRLLTGRISTKSLGGPIEIGAQAIGAAGESLSELMMFLGIISINLAVVNFLPIPVLDGGHMVFLIYEKLRGRPASEAVRIAATYMGLAIILSLMVFVFWLDIRRRFM